MRWRSSLRLLRSSFRRSRSVTKYIDSSSPSAATAWITPVFPSPSSACSAMPSPMRIGAPKLRTFSAEAAACASPNLAARF
ncbi:unnamed protein product [Closterium sp. NIES-54]